MNNHSLADKNGMPLRETFAFGYDVCALCDKPVRQQYTVFTLDEPVWADHKKTEVLIPAGRQRLHSNCYLRLEE